VAVLLVTHGRGHLGVAREIIDRDRSERAAVQAPLVSRVVVDVVHDASPSPLDACPDADAHTFHAGRTARNDAVVTRSDARHVGRVDP
jgi:hypothetical protein